MKTVLFIEDNADIRDNMGEILELANYKVLLAEDGKKGVAMALAETPDIIICDIMMPELDGYGVIHLLQKHPEMQRIPFIFLTAKSERAELRKGMELGADDYITKPFSGTELLNAIEGRLKKSESLKELLGSNLESLNTIVEQTNNKDLKQAFEEGKETHEYKAKQAIYTFGHKAFRLYHVDSGKVKIFKTNDDGKDLIISICQAGEFFGYTALLENANYRETAEALEPSEISSITRESFEELMHNNPRVMLQFVKLLAGNVREKEDQLLHIAYNSLRKKVADALMRIHQKYKSDNAASAAPIHISRETLASIAGTAKESLIRTLGDFRDEGLIEINGGNITILQEKKMSNLAN